MVQMMKFTVYEKVPPLNFYSRIERGFRLFDSNEEGLYNITEVEIVDKYKYSFL